MRRRTQVGRLGMVSVVKATCQCGFEQRMGVGGIMHSFQEYSSFPFFFSECGLVSVNTAVRPIECPNGSSHHVVQYGSTELYTRREPARWERWLGIKCHSERLTEVMSSVTNVEGEGLAGRNFNRRLQKRWHLCPSCRNMSLEFEDLRIRGD